MSRACFSALLTAIFCLVSSNLTAYDPPPLSEEVSKAAASNYQKYCSLCHGADRQGYVNDDAPSLRSASLISSGFPDQLTMTIGFGRHGTPMGAYLEDMGGPMTEDEVDQLATWLKEQSGHKPIELGEDPVSGDVVKGKEVYEIYCSVCHGDNGEGDVGPAIGNPAMLSNASDAFLRYAIENGRDGTDMPSFKEDLTAQEIDNVTAFLRSRVAGWEKERPVLRTPPTVDEYILNPDSPAPEFNLKDSAYVMAAELDQALREKRRMVLLDTRVTSMWQMAHIEGSIPIPYYYEYFDDLSKDLPDDGTWLVIYCECPRAAAESVNHELRDRGFKNTAVLWEGIQGWAALGYPVALGQTVKGSEIKPSDPLRALDRD